jgi:alkaline phosphatase D
MNESINRRTFIRDAATATAGLAIAGNLTATAADAPPLESRWAKTPDRVWIGADFWANPMQDWRIAGGRVECVKAGPGRTLHVLTRSLGEHGQLEVSVKIGALDFSKISEAAGGAGFIVGVQGPLKEYRNSLIFGSGLQIGFRAKGELFIGDGPKGVAAPIQLPVAAVELRLFAKPVNGGYHVALSAHDAASGGELGRVERAEVPAEFLVGNIALSANFGTAPGPGRKAPAGPPLGADRWWFADLKISGSKLLGHDERAFGPIFFTSYAIHRGVLKLTAQMAPVGATEEQRVQLQFERDGRWDTVAEAKIDPLSRTAAFRMENWDSTKEVKYRVAYLSGGADFYEGIFRRDPVDADVLTVADVSCNAHYAFPNSECAERLVKLNPDMVAFTGDQYYEPTGGFGVDASSVENAVLDVLRKWCMHGWTWRELTRNRPSVSLPDDHDVYHGNLWGEGGAAAPARTADAEAKGGYKMMAEFVNAVHRMQTSHHPDSPAQPGKQGITGYFGPLTYGRVSFAILADRQYKTGPAGKVPPTSSGRADHVNDPNFDPKTADLQGLDLLGAQQMEFLKSWTRDWQGADMKAAISQTLFTAMATHHGSKKNMLVADYDTNAWPQKARNDAVRELRRVFAFHLAGDQHLPAVVHYGVDAHRDGVAAFASPAVNNLYPRWFLPPGTDKVLGDFRDSFGHPMTVLACANPKDEFRPGVLESEMDKSSGFGVVRFDKKKREIIVECWPLLADPVKPGTQFSGWPVVIPQLENYARAAVGQLPEIAVTNANHAVLAVIEESSGETIYSLRLSGRIWKPFVFAEGSYTVRVSDPERGVSKELKGIVASKSISGGTLEITL